MQTSSGWVAGETVSVYAAQVTPGAALAAAPVVTAVADTRGEVSLALTGGADYVATGGTSLRRARLKGHVAGTATRDVRSAGGYSYGDPNATALRAFRAALAGRAAAACNIVCLGDSTEEGTGAGVTEPDRAKAWPNRLAELLRQRFPTVGETAVQMMNFQPINTSGPVATRFAKAGAWAGTTQFGATANAARSSTAGDTITFTMPAGCTSVDVLSLGGTAATGWTFTIDAGAASATQGLGGSTRDGVASRITSPDAGATAHTIVITTVGVNNYIGGVVFYSGNETKGIRVFNLGRHGSRADNYRIGGSYNWIPVAPGPTVLGGIQNVGTLAPDLVVVGWGINDYGFTLGVAGYQAALQEIIASVRAVVSTKIVPVLILGKWKVSSAAGTSATWADFRAAREAVAAADPLTATLELGSIMPDIGSAEATTLGLYADTQHSVAKGYTMASDAIASFLAP